MSDDKEHEQPPTPSPQEKYSGSPPPKPFSASLQRASYNDDDMIWPAPSGGYGDAEPTLPRQGREFSIRLNATTLMVIGGVALLLIVALLATALLRNNTSHPVAQRPPAASGGAIAQGTASVDATPSVIGSATNTPIATAATASTPGGNPVVAPTRGNALPAATKLPTATPTPPTCNTIDPSGSPVTLFGDDGVSGDSGSGTTIGSMSSYLEVKRAVSGNACIITSVQQIVNVNLNNAPETDGSSCTNYPYLCVARGTLVQTDQSTQQILSTNTNGYPFGGQVSRNIYGGSASAPLSGNQCVTGTTEYTDNFSRTHQGGSVHYCWTS